MSIDINELPFAYDLWSSFKEEIIYNNRFIKNHTVLDYLTKITEKSQTQIEKDTILYRARVFNRDDSLLSNIISKFNAAKGQATIDSQKQNEFLGYDEKNSFVPSNSDLVGDGRANPSYIKYLYTAEEPYTALVEVRPYLDTEVSVAEIKVNESLKIADFTYERWGRIEDGVMKNLMFLIMSDLSKPSDSDKKSYIPTQYVAEYIKAIGMDGIKFNSSLYSRGRNVTIFNYDKCIAIASKLYKIKDICYEASAVAPKGEQGLIHWKLESSLKENLINLLPPIP